MGRGGGRWGAVGGVGGAVGGGRERGEFVVLSTSRVLTEQQLMAYFVITREVDLQGKLEFLFWQLIRQYIFRV